MKKIVYILIILIFFGLLLKGCIKKDLGYDPVDVQASVRPLDVVHYEPYPQITKTINGVDYMVSSAPLGKFGGDIIVSTIGEGPKTFNPFNSNDATSSILSGIMYDGLVGSDPYTGEITLRMAKRFERIDDLTYLAELRHGLKWSDGVEITADDVVFTFNEIVFQGFGDTSTRDNMYVDGKLPRVEKIDKYTIKFTTPVPFAPFKQYIGLSIAPKHIFKPAVDKGKEYFRTFYSTSTPPKDFVTSGAFRLKEYIPAQRVIYERNPNYYIINKNDEKLPYLDRWVFLIVGDLNNDIIKFEAGETDVLSLHQGSMVSRYRELEKNSDYFLYNLGPSTATSLIVFNMNTRKNNKGEFYVDPIKQMWFNDKNFRSAIDWAIDRESIVLNVLSGVGEPLYTAESIPSIYLNKEVAKGHPQDLSKAKELLYQSGFKLKDGILYDKYGNRVEFELLTNAGNTIREAVGVSIKEDLSKLGIKVNFKPIEFNSLTNKLTNTVNYDAVIISLTGNPLEAHTGNNVWRSDGALHLFNQRTENDLKSSDKILPFEKELDKIFDEAKIEMNEEKRHQYYNRYQEIVAEYNPVIYLYSPANIVAIRKKFKNIRPSLLQMSPVLGVINNIDEIYIE